MASSGSGSVQTGRLLRRFELVVEEDVGIEAVGLVFATFLDGDDRVGNDVPLDFQDLGHLGVVDLEFAQDAVLAEVEVPTDDDRDDKDDARDDRDDRDDNYELDESETTTISGMHVDSCLVFQVGGFIQAGHFYIKICFCQ